ncbi:hypothetical protein EZI54_04235 [Marinobacter halodurans]|uniref:Uncharacterized protein n=1 Tax=Marinobacter halodurans TaxID=2528979 RepID=A0ABY1ZPD8_9GAMM|nr:hypothetical protein [Marinobacter halodurans]TBW58601.1 hypothetical protein EZI54_04235 [Marinobacter halodurans]
MPAPQDILAGLQSIANDWSLLAILWHGYFAALMLGLVFGLHLKERIVGVLLAIPLFSVSALAWIHGNPFNGILFTVTGVVLLGMAVRLQGESVGISPMRFTIPGAFLIVFGWFYPHFLNDTALVAYLYSAPTGLVPCPTLSIVIGFTLMLRGLRSRAWCSVLSVAGVFYGAFGAGRLGVTIDWILFFGALVAAYAAFSSQLIRRCNGEAAR